MPLAASGFGFFVFDGGILTGLMVGGRTLAWIGRFVIMTAKRIGLAMLITLVCLQELTQALVFVAQRGNVAVALAATGTIGTGSTHGQTQALFRGIEESRPEASSEVHPHCTGAGKGQKVFCDNWERDLNAM